MHVSDFYTALAPTPTQYLTTLNGKRLWIKRDDLNDTQIQGNKLRKLKGILLQAEGEKRGLMSFGGAYSNHIFALAAAGNRFHIPTCGIIRGQELISPERQNAMLKAAQLNGMILHFVSRAQYRQKAEGDIVKQQLATADWRVIPEGGSHPLALSGVANIVDEIVADNQIGNAPIPDRLFCACGTGGTLAGILRGVAHHRLSTRCIGVPVLKGADFLYQDIRDLNPAADATDWDLHLHAHSGGYGKTTPELHEFIAFFEHTFNVPIEPIYTGKLCQAVFEQAKNSDSQVEDWLIYHSGGV